MYKAIFQFVNRRMFEKPLNQIIEEEFIETKGAINTKASQESVNTKASQDSINALDTKVQAGNNLIGSPENTGGGFGVGSISAKLNKILTDWTTEKANRLDTSISSRQASWGATTVHRDRIDTNINSRASQASVDNLDTKIQTLANGRVVKSVQYGVTFIAATATSITITHAPVNLQKSFVILNADSWSTGTGGRYYHVSARLGARDPNSFTVLSTGSVNGVAFSWQIVEFY